MATQQRQKDVISVLTRRFFAEHPKTAAKGLEPMERSEAAAILSELPAETMAVAWQALSVPAATETLAYLPAAARAELFGQVETGKLAVLLSRMDPEARAEILAGLDDRTARELQAIMDYPPDTAGSLMDTRVLALNAATTVTEAIDTIRRLRQGKRVSELRLVDDDKRLKAIVDMKDLALADGGETLESISHGVLAFVNPMDPDEEVVDKLERYKLEELPVIDADGHLLGIIRHSELIDTLRETASLDIQTMVGASKDERATSSSWFALRKRMPWLQINLLTAFLAAAVVGAFEDTIAKFTALAVLLPVVAGQSGNAGAQALAVTMRGLALREILVGQWRSVTLKEVNTGFWNGIAIAITCGIGVYIWSGKIGLVIVIAASMVIAMVMAGIAGALVPIVLKRLGQDPAVASSIILTTVTDVAGFLSFLGIATAMSAMLS